MNKYLDTSVLIRHSSGNNIGHFDWYSNIGKEIPFIYDDISGVIKILDYKSHNGKGRITLQYEDKIQENGTSNLLKLNLPSLFGKQKQSTKYLYNINDIIDKGIQSSKVIKRIRIPYNNSDVRGYKLKCLNCNYLEKIGFHHAQFAEQGLQKMRKLFFLYLFKLKLNLKFKKNLNGWKTNGMMYIYQNIIQL